VLKISVIVPSFNQGKFLEENIKSILQQNYPNLEIFVIDGGSTDNSIDIIKKYERKITGWLSEKDSGQSEAINKGFKMSTGDIVSWLCSDDLYKPGTLHRVNELFSTLPESIGVIHGNSEIFKKDNIIRYDKGYGNFAIENQLAGMIFPQPSSFMRTSTLKKAGVLNNSLHYGMDYDLFSRMIMLSDFHYEDSFFSKYRLHEESKSTTALAKFIEEWITVFNSIVEGLQLTGLKHKLKELDLSTKPDSYIVNFFNGHKDNKKFDHDKMLFAFLINVITYDYASDNIARVKKIGIYLRKHFPEEIKSKPMVMKTINRAIYIPPLILRQARTLKKNINRFGKTDQTDDKSKSELKTGIKVAFVTSHINRSTQWIWFSEELNKRKIDHIHIIINEFKPLLYDDLKQHNVNVYYLKHRNKFSFLINIFKVVKILKQNKIELVHSELPYGNLMGLIAAVICRIKMRITTCENTTWFSDFESKKQEGIDRITYFLSKKVIALTYDSYEFLSQHFKISPKKLTTIHHSLKASDYLDLTSEDIEDLRLKLELPKDKFIIGMVARFEYWKGHIYAIEAMKKLIVDYPEIKLYIFGSKGESYESIMKIIKDNKLENSIIYKGFVADNIGLFNLFDIHLHIPIKLKSETFGINIMEGMISGCAQVLTLSGISCFTARDGKNCIIVPYKSSDAVYEALKLLVSDEELRKRLGNQAREDAKKHFKYEDKVDQHLALYEELKRELKL
jgi:glycosyltransferase involved in cell wall biosynthesis